MLDTSYMFDQLFDPIPQEHSLSEIWEQQKQFQTTIIELIIEYLEYQYKDEPYLFLADEQIPLTKDLNIQLGITPKETNQISLYHDCITNMDTILAPRKTFHINRFPLKKEQYTYIKEEKKTEEEYKEQAKRTRNLLIQPRRKRSSAIEQGQTKKSNKPKKRKYPSVVKTIQRQKKKDIEEKKRIRRKHDNKSLITSLKRHHFSWKRKRRLNRYSWLLDALDTSCFKSTLGFTFYELCDFWSWVDIPIKHPISNCWIWRGEFFDDYEKDTFALGKYIHTRDTYDKTYMVHQLVFMMYNDGGLILPVEKTIHTCLQRLCCNPNHIKII